MMSILVFTSLFPFVIYSQAKRNEDFQQLNNDSGYPEAVYEIIKNDFGQPVQWPDSIRDLVMGRILPLY